MVPECYGRTVWDAITVAVVKIGNKNYTDGIGWINVGFLIIGTSPHRRVNQRESPTAQLLN